MTNILLRHVNAPRSLADENDDIGGLDGAQEVEDDVQM